MLIGGKEGNVYVRVTETNAFGPVCDDTWNLISVSLLFIIPNGQMEPMVEFAFDKVQNSSKTK